MRIFKDAWFARFARKEDISDEALKSAVDEMEKRYKSEIMMVLHGMAEGLFEIGAISEQEMLEWDRDCLVQEPKPAQKEAHINEQLAISD